MDSASTSHWTNIQLPNSSPITSDILTIPVSDAHETYCPSTNLTLLLNHGHVGSRSMEDKSNNSRGMPSTSSFHNSDMFNIKTQDNGSDHSSYDISVSLASNFQRHLLSSTTNPTISNHQSECSSSYAKKYPTNAFLGSTTNFSDMGLAATDPRNILFSPEVRSSVMNLDTKMNHVPFASPSSHTNFNDIIPNLPKIPLAGLDVQANLPVETELSSEGLLDISLTSPSFSVSSTSVSAMMPPPQCQDRGNNMISTPIKMMRPAISACDFINGRYLQDSLRYSNDCEPLMSTAAVRLLPDVISARSTPSVRLLPSSSPLDSITPTNIVESNVITSQPVRLYPLKQQHQHLQLSSDQRPESKYIFVNSDASPTIKAKETFLLTGGPCGVNSFPKSETKLIYQQRNIMEQPPMVENKKKTCKIESVSFFKCSVCGFLASTMKSATDHMNEEHEDAADLVSDWFSVAKRENIGNECPFCPNKFYAENSRSFKIHLMDDHDQSEEESAAHFKIVSQIRKDKTLEFMKKRRQEEREKRKRAKKEMLEAYLDDSGELRVRNVLSSSQRDITASEFVKKAKLDGDKMNNKKRGILLEEVDRKDLDLSNVKRSVVKRSRVGRPCGSRTIGMTRLRKLNPEIALSDDKIGSECLVNDCAVRLMDEEKLAYHRQSHQDAKGFKCQECHEVFDKWQTLALHLWRIHKLDMELFSCDLCESFRSFTLARLEAHKLAHRDERPHQCDFCAKKFKTARNLKTHEILHKIKSDPSSKTTQQGDCTICKRSFTEKRLLKLHMDTVHRKLKPHLCNYCGYSASSKSSLKLHLRLHTGEKNYFCGECQYRTADHNSLRRHKMRHSGEKKYKCPHCSYSSIQSSTYKVHLKSKHPQELEKLVFICTHCKFQTVKEGNFLAHMAEHEDQKSAKNNSNNITAEKGKHLIQTKKSPSFKD